MPLRRYVLPLFCLLLAACTTTPGAAKQSSSRPAGEEPSPPAVAVTAVPGAVPGATTEAAPPAASPTPSEMRRLAAATRALEAPSSGGVNIRLASAYATLRDRHQPPLSHAAAARTIQLATAQLLGTPAWRPGAIAALKTSDRPSLEAILSAGDELTPLGDEVSGAPQWRISAPDPAASLVDDYHEGERAYGIPWQYLAAINFVETAMGRIHGLSVAGAQGPMQFMPATWATFGRGDVNNPRDAVLAAARYLHASGGPADMDGALYSYNRSHHYVRAIDIFAAQLAADPDAFSLYYDWQVIVPTSDGPAIIPEGWSNQ